MFNFEKLEVWQTTRIFSRKIHTTTSLFPKEEQFGLTQHIRKTTISVLSNISEATSRFSNADFKRFIEIAIGSLYEVISQLFIALDNGYLTKEDFEVLYKDAEVIAKMLSKFSNSRKT